jgi:hypothetical protein
MKVLSWTGIFRRLASIQTVRDLVRRSVYHIPNHVALFLPWL